MGNGHDVTIGAPESVEEHPREDWIAAPGGDDDSVSQVVASEQVRLAFEQGRTGLAAGAIAALMVVYASRDTTSFTIAAGWLVCFALVSLARWWLVGEYSAEGRQFGEAPKWRNRWTSCLFATGCVWGAAGVIFQNPDFPEISVFIAFILGGLVSGSIATQATLFRAYLAFTIPAIVPISVWFLVQGREPALWMGVMAVVYGITLIFAARYYSENIRRSLTLGVENMGLVHELVDANEIAQDTNRALEAEIVERTQTEEARRRSEEHFRNLIDGSTQGIAVVRSWRVLFANDTYARILGYETSEDVVGLHVIDDLTPSEDQGSVHIRIVERYRGRGAPQRFEGRAVRRDGAAVHIEYTLHQVNWYGQRTTQITATDTTERNRAEKALRASQERFRDFAETAADWFYETDDHLRYTYVSERFQQISGWRPEEIIGLTHRDLLRDSIEDPEKLDRHYKELDERRPYQVDLLSAGKDGTLHVFHYAGKPIFDEHHQFCGYRGAGRDVTQAYQLSKQLSYQATHDALTGLLNRRAFEQRLERVLNTARDDGSTHALSYLDLDQFKVINDTCGHMAGDELLRQLGRMLPTYIRKRDTLSRLGGDEFGVLMEHCSLAQAERVARAICRAIEEFQFVWEDRTFRIGCSIGLVPISDASESAASVMSSADTACYTAKDQGRRRVHVHHPGDEELTKRRGEMQWAVRINRALEEDRFRLFYQPIAPVVQRSARQLSLEGIAPPDEVGIHMEILIRLEEYDGTLTPPGAFLPAAERYNLSAQLDRWVCDSTINWMATHRQVLDQLRLCAINLSGHSLGDASLLHHLCRRFDRGDLDPSLFCFEITETAAISNLADATQFIQTLGERGCQFALDDFGSGLSSFAYLKTLPVQYLKIDGVFVKDIADDPIDLAMVRSINEIGQVMGKLTVAEFVESEEIFAELSAIGVNYAQGYSVAPPRPIEALLELYQDEPVTVDA